jgi:hypothetical protein
MYTRVSKENLLVLAIGWRGYVGDWKTWGAGVLEVQNR